jgi:hypothetical protein
MITFFRYMQIDLDIQVWGQGKEERPLQAAPYLPIKDRDNK